MGSYSGFLVAFLAEDLAARSQHPYPASPWPDASRPRNSPGCPHGTTPSYHSQVERVPKPEGPQTFSVESKDPHGGFTGKNP